jgi:hypothetical protein
LLNSRAVQDREQTLNTALPLPRPRAIHRDRGLALTGNLSRPTGVGIGGVSRQ